MTGIVRDWSLRWVAFVGMVASVAVSEGRPNIVLIFCDDLGYADVGFNAELFGVETDVVTPEIDALAAKGTIY